jgi:hypothetical protein
VCQECDRYCKGVCKPCIAFLEEKQVKHPPPSCLLSECEFSVLLGQSLHAVINPSTFNMDREVAGSILSHGMFSPGSRETVGESRREGTALVLATLRRTASIAGYIHTSPARCAVHRMG